MNDGGAHGRQVLWPVTLVLWHGLAATVFGIAITATGDGAFIVIGAAFLISALMTLVPRVWAGDDGLRVRNFVRRRHWSWDEIERITPRRTGVLFTRFMALVELEVHDGRETFPMLATMSYRLDRAVGFLSATAAAHGVEVDRGFPCHDEIRDEWASRQETERRLDDWRRSD